MEFLFEFTIKTTFHIIIRRSTANASDAYVQECPVRLNMGAVQGQTQDF